MWGLPFSHRIGQHPASGPGPPSSRGLCCHTGHLPHLALPSQPPSPIQRGTGEGHALRRHQAGPRGPASPLGPHTRHHGPREAAQFLRGQGQLEPESLAPGEVLLPHGCGLYTARAQGSLEGPGGGSLDSDPRRPGEGPMSLHFWSTFQKIPRSYRPCQSFPCVSSLNGSSGSERQAGQE